ncbi:MAG TPA: aspartate aminotransferase family protein [Chloroflexota bacterium]|nr:aspartate aminotransferase family protein [Chloroflexota bacterium]
MQPQRGRALLRDLYRTNPRIARGEGVYLYDEDGRRYLDGAGGASAVNNIGHGRASVAEVMAQQARTVAYTPAFCFSSKPIEELAELAASLTPGDLNNFWFVNGGSEATENAVKIARQHFIESGQAAKQIVIARWQSFHGNTLGSLGFGGHTYRRRRYMGMYQNQPHIAPAYPYRCAYARGGERLCRCDLSCAAELEREIRRQGPENVAAFIAEPVVGAALGAVPAPPGYFQAIREICDRYNVLFIADEVMTGFGRTGKMFGIEHWGVTPDLMACAKGMASGYAPLGAVAVSDRVMAPILKARQNIVGGHTYAAHTLTCAVGVEVLRIVVEERLAENAERVGRYLLDAVTRLLAHPLVGDVRGLGLMVGLELVRDKATKEPFPPEQGVAQMIVEEGLQRGVIVYPGNGSVDGVAGDHIKLSPPLILTEEQADELVAGLAGALDAVAERLGVAIAV